MFVVTYDVLVFYFRRNYYLVCLSSACLPTQLVVWREEDHSLTALSKDHEDCHVFSAEYLIDEPGMAIVVADGRRNIRVCVNIYFEAIAGHSLIARDFSPRCVHVVHTYFEAIAGHCLFASDFSPLCVQVVHTV